jgi:hypothetical protein
MEEGDAEKEPSVVKDEEYFRKREEELKVLGALERDRFILFSFAFLLGITLLMIMIENRRIDFMFLFTYILLLFPFFYLPAYVTAVHYEDLKDRVLLFQEDSWSAFVFPILTYMGFAFDLMISPYHYNPRIFTYSVGFAALILLFLFITKKENRYIFKIENRLPILYEEATEMLKKGRSRKDERPKIVKLAQSWYFIGYLPLGLLPIIFFFSFPSLFTDWKTTYIISILILGIIAVPYYIFHITIIMKYHDYSF